MLQVFQNPQGAYLFVLKAKLGKLMMNELICNTVDLFVWKCVSSLAYKHIAQASNVKQLIYNYDKITFYSSDNFGNQSMISQSSQKNTPCSFIIQNQTILFEGVQKQMVSAANDKQQSENKKNATIQQAAKKNKEKVAELLTTFEQYKKIEKSKLQQHQKARDDTFQKIKTQLKNFGHSLQKDKFNSQDIIQKINLVKQESQIFIRNLYQSKPLTLQAMVSNFPSLVCKIYFMDKQAKSLDGIVDYANSSFQANNERIGFDKKQLSFSEKSSFQKFDKTFAEKSNSVDIGGIVQNPFWFVKADIKNESSSVNQSASQNSETIQTYTQLYFSIYRGAGVLVSQNSIKIKSHIIRSYEDLYEQYLVIKKKRDNNLGTEQYIKTQNKFKQLKQKVIQFFQKHGNQVEIGNYYFGSIFLLKNSFTYNAKNQLNQVQLLAHKSVSAQVSGGTPLFAVNVGGSTSSSSGQSSGSTNQTSSIAQLKQHFSNLPVENYKQWKQLIVFCTKYWALLESRTQRFSIYDIMINQLNKCPQDQYFKEFLTDTYKKYVKHSGKDLKPQQLQQIRICLIGPSGVGKSTLGNAIIGDHLEPFQVGKGADSCTRDVVLRSNGKYICYDTPGFAGNSCAFQKGELERLIADKLISENDRDGLTTPVDKKINAFLIVTKATLGFETEQSLVYMREMFGWKVLLSSIFVFNFEYKSKKTEQEQNLIIQNLSTIFDFFQPCISQHLQYNIRNLVYFNYLPDQDIDLKNQSLYQNKKRNQLMKKIRNLEPYTSNTYENYQKQLEMQNKRKIRIKQEQTQLLNKQHNQWLLKLKTQQELLKLKNKIYGVSSFTLKDKQSQQYIKFGCIENTILTSINIGQKGFTIGGWERLYLAQMEINIENKTITGLLCSTKATGKYACTNNDWFVGYRFRYMNQDKVVIKFQDGQRGMRQFSDPQKQLAYVTVAFEHDDDRYFYDEHGLLKRGIHKRIFQLVAV